MNVFIGIGRLGRDPEAFTTRADKQGARFSMAIDNPFGEKDDQGKPRPDWFNVTCFGQSAEFALRFLRKGAQVAVRGDVHLNEWEKDGQKRSGLDVMADRVEAVGPKQEGASAPQQRPAPAPSVDWTSEETEDPFGDQ